MATLEGVSAISFDLEAWVIQEHESHICLALKNPKSLDTKP